MVSAIKYINLFQAIRTNVWYVGSPTVFSRMSLFPITHVIVDILGVTLDLDDGSIKQPTGSDDSTKFPKVSKVKC